MNKKYKIILSISIVLVLLFGTVYGSIKMYNYIIEKQRENAEYDSIPMKFNYSNTYPDEFYISRNTRQYINLDDLTTDKEKVLHILQVADYNYANSMYLGRYRKGETNMTATINKPISSINPEKDMLLKSRVISEVFDFYNYEITFNNKNGVECASCYEQAVFFMNQFSNEGKANPTMETLLPYAIDALNKGGYFVIYDKIYYKTLKYPRYNEETDSFELTDNQLYVTEFNTITKPNGDLDDIMKPIITFFPFALTDEIISDDGLELTYDAEERVYTIKFSANTDLIDSEWAAEYFDYLLNFQGGVLSHYAAEVKIWDTGMLKSINESHTWDLVFDTGVAGIKLYMNMPLNGTTIFSYHPDDTDVASKLYLVN